jgi:hypothetical protein
MTLDMRIVEMLPEPAEIRMIERCAVLSMPQYNRPSTIISALQPGETVTMIGTQLGNPRWICVRPFPNLHGWVHIDSVLGQNAVTDILERRRRQPIYIAGMKW